LVHLYATKPRRDEALFNSFIEKQQAIHQNVMSDPNTLFQDSVYKIVYNSHPRGPKVPRTDDFGKINLDRSLEIYKERFSDASGFTFIFTGSFDVEAIKPLLNTYLASLPSTSAKSAFRDIGLRPVRGVITKKIYKGTEEKSIINLSFYGEAPYTESEKLKLQGLVELLNIKLIETLREDMSGVYGAGAYGTLNKNPYNNYSLVISMPCGPENVDKLVKATFDEIQKVKEKGCVEADLNKVKETWRKQYQENIKDNSFWAKQLQAYLESGSNNTEILSYEKRVEALTTNDIKETANKYFDLSNYVLVILYPEK
jgi:zinc protease